jgi:hypothetical protein
MWIQYGPLLTLNPNLHGYQRYFILSTNELAREAVTHPFIQTNWIPYYQLCCVLYQQRKNERTWSSILLYSIMLYF